MLPNVLEKAASNLYWSLCCCSRRTQIADFSAGTTSLLPTRSTPRCDLWSSESKEFFFFFSFSAQFAESIESGDNKGHRDKVPLYQCAGAHSKFALNAGWPELTLPTIGTHQSLPERAFLLNAALRRFAAAYLSCRSDFSTSGRHLRVRSVHFNV